MLEIIHESRTAIKLSFRQAHLLAFKAAGNQDGFVIIALANIKGGVSKSTLAVHLSTWLEEQGHRVILADCDTQQSSSEWATEAIPNVRTVRLADPNEILNEIPQLGQECDYLVADGPGSNSEISRALLLRADVALVPCKASMLEVRSLSKATEVLRQAQEIRSGMPESRLILTMVREQYRLTGDMKKTAKALGFQIARRSLTLRQIYADAPGQGTVVWKMETQDHRAQQKATEEVWALFRELFPKAIRSSRKQSRKRTPVNLIPA